MADSKRRERDLRSGRITLVMTTEEKKSSLNKKKHSRKKKKGGWKKIIKKKNQARKKKLVIVWSERTAVDQTLHVVGCVLVASCHRYRISTTENYQRPFAKYPPPAISIIRSIGLNVIVQAVCSFRRRRRGNFPL